MIGVHIKNQVSEMLAALALLLRWNIIHTSKQLKKCMDY